MDAGSGEGGQQPAADDGGAASGSARGSKGSTRDVLIYGGGTQILGKPRGPEWSLPHGGGGVWTTTHPEHPIARVHKR